MLSRRQKAVNRLLHPNPVWYEYKTFSQPLTAAVSEWHSHLFIHFAVGHVTNANCAFLSTFPLHFSLQTEGQFHLTRIYHQIPILLPVATRFKLSRSTEGYFKYTWRRRGGPWRCFWRSLTKPLDQTLIQLNSTYFAFIWNVQHSRRRLKNTETSKKNGKNTWLSRALWLWSGRWQFWFHPY